MNFLVALITQWIRSTPDPMTSVKWSMVRDEERGALGQSPALGPQRPTTGLAFSGGGIRSATFCLGVIQAFSKAGVLKRFDYLSTVSGGGYIGSWLSAFIKRRAAGNVAEAERILANQLPPTATLRAPQATDVSHEDIALQWLRRYSNYLTPRVGLAGVDTWTAISTYARNLTLNWLVLGPLFLSAILAIAALLAAGARMQAHADTMLVAALVALCVVAFSIGRGIDLPRDNIKPSAFRDGPTYIFLISGVGTLLAAWFVAIALGDVPPSWHKGNLATWGGWLLVAMCANLGAWLIAGVVRHAGRIDGEPPHLTTPDFEAGSSMTQSRGWWVVIAAIPGIFAGAMAKWWSDARVDWAKTYEWEGLAPAAFDTVIGTPVMMLIISNAVLLFIGLAKRRMSETDREWLGRLGAILFLLGIGWLLAFGMLWLGAVAKPLFSSGAQWLVGVGAGAWLLQSLAALILGKSAITGASNDKGSGKPKLEAIIALAPYVFFAGLIALMSSVTFSTLKTLHSTPPEPVTIGAPHMGPLSPAATTTIATANGAQLILTAEKTDTPLPRAMYLATGETLSVMQQVGGYRLAGYALALFVLCVAMSFRVDINLFSYNRFYGNRLGRAYLGASRERNVADERKAHPFSDFDPDDDLAMSRLAMHLERRPTSVQRPLHIINTALNLTGSPDLAWQSRKSASFTFSPLHCGFALPTSQATSGVTPVPSVDDYRRSFEYGSRTPKDEPVAGNVEINSGVTFGMAFPTSGAAASPNMGAHSSPAYAMLLTIFNVRLGRWFGNPRNQFGSWRRRTPISSLAALLSELLGRADYQKPWLYLSDGGHFENLGIYELVRRRLPVIVVIDAAQDEDYSFTDLANAIRLCSADFGVRITFRTPLGDVRPDDKTSVAKSGHLFGSIEYPEQDGEPAFHGQLVYVKPTLLANLPADLFEYARRGTGFPQETTGDQWFSESQFESYRHLGETIATTLCSDADFKKLI